MIHDIPDIRRDGWSLRPIAVSFAPLALGALLTFVILCRIDVRELRTSPVVLATSWVWSMMIVVWLESDARRRRLPCFDFGLFAYLFWPITLIWYCVWSRGWMGLLTVLGVFALFYAPFFAATVVGVIRLLG